LWCGAFQASGVQAQSGEIAGEQNRSPRKELR
jgi:hypothetical protein